MCPTSMKFATQNKLKMLIINTLIGIDELVPKVKGATRCYNFYEIRHLEQMNMLIMNIVLRIDDINSNYRIGKI